jgi:glycosyltransferase involved in cell wall biosynthesis
MSVTVVIATYNRAALLAECLQHLSRQNFAPHDEVIVVDNGSTDETPRVIADSQDLFSVPLRHLSEAKAGKSNAVAAALDIASGDILAFTDDDVDVGAGWRPGHAALGNEATRLAAYRRRRIRTACRAARPAQLRLRIVSARPAHGARRQPRRPR